MDPRKRWMTVGVRDAAGGGWRLSAPEPVGDVGSLFARLLSRAGGQAVALGVDVPLGLPRGYAALHGAGADGFPAFLASLAAADGFFRVCEELAQVGPRRPFYPHRGRAGMTRDAHAQALGLDGRAALCRACDRATAARPAGAPPFWTLGANQSGKAAIAAWRDLLLPALAADAPPLLWPFAGDLLALLRPGRVAVAEAYPAESLRQLGLRLGGSKRAQPARAALAPALRPVLDRLDARPAPELAASIDAGFGPDAAGEDRFDSTIGLLGLLGVLAGHRPDGIPHDPWLRTWEGWVLGQTDLPLDRITPAAPR